MRVFLSTADASGDLHAAGLLEALRKRSPELEAFGLGGAALERAGLELLVQQSELAVAGLVEVLRSAGRVLGAYARLRRALRERRPDVCVFVDSPDLNLPLAAVARRLGLRSLYYVAPQVWAWREGRVAKLRARVDRVAVILPFEEEFLRRHGIDAVFVGHPLVERLADVRAALEPRSVARELQLDLGRPLLSLLPGSRTNELDANLPVMVEAAALLRDSFPSLQVLLLVAPTLSARAFKVPDFVRVVRGRTHEAMALSTVLISAPGTATMEAALLGVPFVVCHRVHPLTFALARRLVRVPSACLVNLIAGAGVAPERLQSFARPATVAGAAARLLRDPGARDELRGALAAACGGLGGPGAASRAAAMVAELAATPGRH